MLKLMQKINNTEVAKTFLVFSVFITLFSALAIAQPVAPAAYYGNAVINGRDVPAGSVITAEINGVQKGSVTVQTAGKYGQTTQTEGRLVVQGGEDGDTITFFVQTPQMSNKLQAAETSVWHSLTATNLNLTFTGEEIPISSGAPPSTGSGSGAGAGGGGGAAPQPKPTNGNASTQSNENPVQPTTQITPQGVEVEVYNLDEIFTSTDTVVLSLNKGDVVQFTLGGTVYSVVLSALGPGEAILTVGGKTIPIKLNQDASVDVNNDGKEDISVKASSISDTRARLSFKRAFEPSSITGFAIASPVELGLAAVVIIIIIIAALQLKKRSVSGRKK